MSDLILDDIQGNTTRKHIRIKQPPKPETFTEAVESEKRSESKISIVS